MKKHVKRCVSIFAVSSIASQVMAVVPVFADTSGNAHHPETGTTAVKVSDFLNSLGVNTHIGQGVDNASQTATALNYLGIHHTREDANPDYVQDWIQLHKQSGDTIDLLADGGASVSSNIEIADQLRKAGALLDVEGPNEPNNQPVTYDGQTSNSSTFLPVAYFQRDLYSAVHSDPLLKGIPVFASSEAGGSEPDNVGLQYLTIPNGANTLMPAGTKYADYANTHTYVMGHVGSLIDNMAWNASDPTLNSSWDGLYVEYGQTWNGGFSGYSDQQLKTLPRVMTETGWNTQGSGSLSEAQQGDVLMDVYLSNFARGWKYTFLYMLRDDPVQGYWGLVDTNYQPKPSGVDMHNLTTILADKGTKGQAGSKKAPGQLDYSIPNEPSTVHDLLMQKSNGEFYLAVWDEQASGSSSVTVNLAKASNDVEIYNPTTGTSPVQTLHHTKAIDLTLSGYEPLIIKL
ncbi:hypothetical protein [Alicyclobacillus fodiniaquatilis]|uniref:Glycosyl hydrolase n=1 Tax=Alicyclobacillus fodiniaquatilis TaxID=1661150 RepID=A0ABW4JLZ4_9BACL